jgi:hypothetical protein
VFSVSLAGLSKGAAHYRKVAAHLIQRFPEVVEPLRDGRLCITSVVELARVITPENSSEIVPKFFHRSKQEAKAVAVEIRPAEVIPRRQMVTEVPCTAAFHPDETALAIRSQEPAPRIQEGTCRSRGSQKCRLGIATHSQLGRGSFERRGLSAPAPR